MWSLIPVQRIFVPLSFSAERSNYENTLFGREPDLIIPWDQIKCIGEDTVLVENVACPAPPRRRMSFAGALH